LEVERSRNRSDRIKDFRKNQNHQIKEKACDGMTIQEAARREQSRVYSAFVRDGACGQNNRRAFVSS